MFLPYDYLIVRVILYSQYKICQKYAEWEKVFSLHLIFLGVFERPNILNFERELISSLFYHLCFWFLSKKSLSNLMSQRFSPVFSSRRFIVMVFLHLDLCSILTYFLYMVWGMSWGSFFFFWYMDVRWFEHPFVEGLSLFLELPWQCGWTLVDIVYVALVLESVFCSIGLCADLLSVPH